MAINFLKKNIPAARFFDHWSGKYDADLRDYKYAAPDALFAALEPYIKGMGPAPLRLLDIGIGTGLSAAPFRATGRFFITGVDASRRMLDLCRKNGMADELAQCDVAGQDLPFEDNAFDVIIVGGVLEFIEDAERLFEEILRVLRPGGFVAVTHETPETKKIYPSNFMEGVIEDAERRVVIQRSFSHLFVPHLYRKYLYGERLIEDMFILNNIAILKSGPFTAYQWSPEQPVTYNLIMGKNINAA